MKTKTQISPHPRWSSPWIYGLELPLTNVHQDRPGIRSSMKPFFPYPFPLILLFSVVGLTWMQCFILFCFCFGYLIWIWVVVKSNTFFITELVFTELLWHAFFFFFFLSPIGIKNSSNFLLTTYMTTIKLFRNLLVYSNFMYVWETSWLWSAHVWTNPLIWLYMKLPAALCAIFPWCSFTFLVGLWDYFAVIWTHWRSLLMHLQAMDLFS